ncbi:hypothetical protein B9Z51_04950 [Limnohabitans sp. T6-5]|uniref:OmpW/AlkL family protein n=1 Tax=Limnohabitans sp. T6-5 TaxID=1100724 RepID=UPI000D397A19|nr:OmpW family outer membrane protein [Limnohabitans sp. T6-5]PUE11626.1 hypothetical protein B9Z51_04950 [Limnohabitans sp. T6-5]
MQKKTIVAAAMAVCSATTVMAQVSGEGPWLVRARVVNLDSANSDSTGLGLSIDNKTLGELDFTYFYTKNVATELVLTTPQTQRVYANNSQIGSFRHLPPTLMLQYHFTDMQGFKPYVGAGINYTKFTGVSLPPGLSLSSDQWGGALQAGLDIPLDKNWSINFDIKKVYISTNVYNNGVRIGELKVDPMLYAVGVGYRY